MSLPHDLATFDQTTCRTVTSLCVDITLLIRLCKRAPFVREAVGIVLETGRHDFDEARFLHEYWSVFSKCQSPIVFLSTRAYSIEK